VTARRQARDWPLVLGMVVAAALVFASTRVAASHDSEVRASSQDAKHAAVAGLVPSAAPAEPANGAVATAPKPAKKAATPGAKAHHKTQEQPSAAAKAASPAPAAPDTAQPSTPHKHASPTPPAPAPTPTPAALAVPGKSGQATVGGITFTVRSPSHSPTAGSPWTMTVTAAKNGAPVTGKVTMDVIYQGKVSGHAANAPLAAGSFAKEITWPGRSVGYPLTMRVKIRAGGQTCTFLYDLKVKAAG
jgi:hypothetical protein